MIHESRFLAEIIDESLAPLGFSRKRHTWHLTKDDVIWFFGLDKSTWGKLYSIDVGVVIRKISDSPPPQANECHISTQLGAWYDDKSSTKVALDFENSTIGLDQRRELIRYALLGDGLTFLANFSAIAEIRRNLRDRRRYGRLSTYAVYEFFGLMGPQPKGNFIARTLNEILFPRGFERKKRCWYRTGDETTSRVELQTADYSGEDYVVNIGIVLRCRIDDRFPGADQCHISSQVSLAYDCGSELRTALDDTDFPEDKRKTLLVEALESRVVDFLEAFDSHASIRKSLLALGKPGVVVHEGVREALGLASDV